MCVYSCYDFKTQYYYRIIKNCYTFIVLLSGGQSLGWLDSPLCLYQAAKIKVVIYSRQGARQVFYLLLSTSPVQSQLSENYVAQLKLFKQDTI